MMFDLLPHRLWIERVAVTMITNCSLIVNAGGLSQRMGHPKALLPVPPDGQPLLDHIVERLHAVGEGVAPQATIIIANNPQLCEQSALGPAVRWLSDRYKGIGPLGGIATGLGVITGWSIFVACDMPLLNPHLFEQFGAIAAEGDDTDSGQWDGSGQWDAIVPIVQGYPEPFHALYHRRCYDAVVNAIATGKRRATSFLADVRVRYVHEEEIRVVDPGLHSFLNVNTPEEWQQILPLLMAQRRGTG